uniref:Protein-S-isoprenylcysteine O-methyltransferase n=1 Tax=Palpitomonas bilix TaxID=652834 RepID=A0A7S3CYU7_9EUKA|mmetsp:Transcript_15212/g.38408  ORF Transcript_15212/g.38408 Transcript_15212/m.38408 type:complete len:259 (+) Transcript_15212:209-985(+)
MNVNEISFFITLLYIICPFIYFKFAKDENWRAQIYKSLRYMSLLFTLFLLFIVLGVFLSGGILLYFYPSEHWPLALFLLCLGFFHLSEFFLVAAFNPDQLDESSLLLNMRDYNTALVSAVVEYVVEYNFFPSLRPPPYIAMGAAVVVVIGQAIRTTAVYTAKKAFTHYIQETKRSGHQLVTDGIYSFSRHPGYMGWFYWFVGTQVLLFNPVCFVIYLVVAFMFFKARIAYEEVTLLEMFGTDYAEYKKKVWTGIPFIA